MAVARTGRVKREKTGRRWGCPARGSRAMQLLITCDVLAPGRSQTKPTSPTTRYRTTNYTDPAPSTQVSEVLSLDSRRGSGTAHRSQSEEELIVQWRGGEPRGFAPTIRVSCCGERQDGRGKRTDGGRGKSMQQIYPHNKVSQNCFQCLNPPSEPSQAGLLT